MIFKTLGAGTTGTLQARLKELLVNEILSGTLPAASKLPSCRELSSSLQVSRNTVILAYNSLISDGFIVSRPRSGYYVANDVPPVFRESVASLAAIGHRLPQINVRPDDQYALSKPKDWFRKPYPFIYGQVEEKLFPKSAWRDCSRQALGTKAFDTWADELHTHDDPLLVEQIINKVLVRRGIIARPEEVLVTMGAQHALFLLSQLLLNREKVVAVEDPGYHDARNIFRVHGATIRPVPVDEEGIVVGGVGSAHYVFVTPSHQFPTNVTMSLRRRQDLLNWADAMDSFVIEDDYEFETNFNLDRSPALKSLDRSSRVLYISSFSKSLMPGIRVGFIVADRTLISELRVLRRLMIRHPPGNNQRTLALFLALGHHDAQIKRLHKIYARRLKVLNDSLDRHLPGWALPSIFGGTSVWLRGPKWLDSEHLAARASERGVIILPGNVYFDDPNGRSNYVRLGYSSISDEKIEDGVAIISDIVGEMGLAIDVSEIEPIRNR